MTDTLTIGQVAQAAGVNASAIEELIAHARRVKAWLEATSDCTCDTLGRCSLFDHGLL
jgi:hypothetical protein